LSKYSAQAKVTNKSIFRISKEDLQLFFLKQNVAKPDNDGECRTSLHILKECGYNDGLCELLNTDQQTGIVGTDKDLDRRKQLFGEHKIALPKV
jgi:hypothetical protein